MKTHLVRTRTIHSVALVSLAFLLCSLSAALSQQVLWTLPCSVPQGRFDLQPSVADDGTIYIGTQGNNTNQSGLFAINPNGSVKWKFTTGYQVRTIPAIGTNGMIYFAAGDYSTVTFYGVRPDGGLQWLFRTNGFCDSMALAEDGTVYFGAYSYSPSGWCRLFAFTPDGSLKWVFKAAATEVSGAVRLAVGEDGTIYFGASKTFYAVNPDGTKYWDFPIESAVPTIGANGTILLVGDMVGSAVLWALSPEGFIEWGGQGRGKYVVVGDELLYQWREVIALDGTIICDLYASDVLRPVTVAADETLYSSSGFRLLAFGRLGGIKWTWLVPQDGSVASDITLTPSGTLYFTTLRYTGSPGGYEFNLVAMKVPFGLANTPWPMRGHDTKGTFRAGPGTPIKPTVVPIRYARGHGFQFSLVGERGLAYTIQSSPDMQAWTTWTNLVSPRPVVGFTDPSALERSIKFYRAFPTN